MMTHGRRMRRGLTLIEIVVALAIMALMGSIAAAILEEGRFLAEHPVV